VEITTAKATIAGEPRLVVDTPGTNGLTPHSDDERVARDMLITSPGANVLQVGDMSNMRRTVLLSLQIAEHEVPFTLCLNMSDEARERDSEIDPSTISTALGVPVVATSALRRWNIERRKKEALQPKRATTRIVYPDAIEQGIARVLEALPPTANRQPLQGASPSPSSPATRPSSRTCLKRRYRSSIASAPTCSARSRSR
jgi:Fe2+ transport system protein B